MNLRPEKIQQIRDFATANPGVSDRAIAKALKVSRDAAAKYRGERKAEETEESQMTADTWTFEAKTRERITTLEDLVAFCKIDLDVWDVERWVANKWEVGANIDGKLTVEPLYQVKAFMRKRQGMVAARQEIEDLKELAKKEFPARVPPKPTKETGLMLELNLSDAHLGKLAHTDETRGPNYDTRIAERTYRRAFYALLDRTAGYEFDEVWYVVGNDVMQSDDPEGRTTAGTYVSTDGRYYKTFKIVRSLIIENIEELRKRARVVRVIVVPGNHDERSCFFLGDSIECYFANQPDVVIDNEPKRRKYHTFGKVLLGLTHGHKGKHADYPILMATEVPEMFGASRHREMHCGHKHKTQSDITKIRAVDEAHGVRVRILSALTPADSWHSDNGFVGNLRASEAFVWHRTEGLIATAVYTEPD